MSGTPWGVATSGRNWYQIFLLVLTIVFVGTSWASGGEGQVIASTFPTWAQFIWYGGLTFGAVVALYGIALHTVTGMLVERAALFFLSGLALSYGTAFLAASDRAEVFHAFYVVFFVYAFAATNLTRAWQVRRDIDEERRKLRQIGNLRETLHTERHPEVPPS